GEGITGLGDVPRPAPPRPPARRSVAVSGHLLRARVRAALRAALERALAPRLRADDFAWRESAFFEPADRPSCLRTRVTVRPRRREVRRWPRSPTSRSRSALRRVARELVPGWGARSFTPARRAFERPMAIACFVERAPCLPSRTCSISSRTNSPACVLADLPSRASSRARSNVRFSGMISLLYLPVEHPSCQ